MKLSEYMEKNGVSDEALAKAVGRERSTVTRWRLEKTRPDWDVLAKLEQATNKKVRASDFYPEVAQ
jgi:transcriptional regulator with XRE-family HTH domain